jgi:N-acetylmuramoyl-L-alanine amidase
MKVFLKSVSVIMCIAILFLSVVITANGYSTIGSRGNEVRNIQQRLRDWGYYKGAVDGIYGTKTRSAVIKFQKKHNITGI